MLPKTSDVYVDIELREDDLEDGTAGPVIDYDALPGCMILVYQDISNPLLEYQKHVPTPNPTGIKSIGVTNGANGEIYILVPRSKTKVTGSGDLYLQVFVGITDAGSESNLFRAVGDPVKIESIVDTVGKNKNILV